MQKKNEKYDFIFWCLYIHNCSTFTIYNWCNSFHRFIEIIIEVAICKSVLKPLREAVYNGLKDIHSHAGNLKKLKENQQVVLGSTTTDLGVNTSIPEMAIMDKIHIKLGNLHKEYSPQKKIDLLLKTCKIIYESMSVGSQGGFKKNYNC